MWANNHVNPACETIDRLAHTPLATAMTVAAIAIALALPATLSSYWIIVNASAAVWNEALGLLVFATRVGRDPGQ